jgi:hypothetical protein
MGSSATACAICGESGPWPESPAAGEPRHMLNSAGRVMHIPQDAELGWFGPSPDDPLWWLSFCDPDLPAGGQFLGVAVIQAPTFPAAVTRSHSLGVNPGGQVASAGPILAGCIGAEWRDRLLTRDEALSIPEPQGL